MFRAIGGRTRFSIDAETVADIVSNVVRANTGAAQTGAHRLRREWTAAEQATLIDGVKTFGKSSPAKIAAMPLLARNGRTAKHVRNKMDQPSAFSPTQAIFLFKVAAADATFVAARAARLGVAVRGPPPPVPAGLEHIAVAGAAGRGADGGRREAVAWADVEIDAIFFGVRTVGTHEPSKILATDTIFLHNGRTAVDIANKLRTMRLGAADLKSRLAAAVAAFDARSRTRGVRF
jgi:hypothetical protein